LISLFSVVVFSRAAAPRSTSVSPAPTVKERHHVRADAPSPWPFPGQFRTPAPRTLEYRRHAPPAQAPSGNRVVVRSGPFQRHVETRVREKASETPLRRICRSGSSRRGSAGISNARRLAPPRNALTVAPGAKGACSKRMESRQPAGRAGCPRRRISPSASLIPTAGERGPGESRPVQGICRTRHGSGPPAYKLGRPRSTRSCGRKQARAAPAASRWDRNAPRCCPDHGQAAEGDSGIGGERREVLGAGEVRFDPQRGEPRRPTPRHRAISRQRLARIHGNI